MLTKKQYQLLVFIDKKLKEAGVAPSFEEMKEALGLRSKSGVHRLITALEERKFLRRLPHRARALEILRLPENMEGAPVNNAPAPAPSPASSNILHPSFGKKSDAAEVQVVELPLYGRIAAGTPIDALRDPSSTIDIPASLLDSGEHYALEVDGDSMIDAGINDDDIVIIRKADSAENGSIVVALVDGGEVTLKRLRRKGASVALEPANEKYETRIFPPDRVQVQGKLVGLFRRY
ncbi:MAG: transcriptional repressor LexA [Magnetospiraceae bacterium]